MQVLLFHEKKYLNWRSKAVLSGAKLYLHISLCSLSGTWKPGDSVICATRVGYQPSKQANCLLGMVRRGWNAEIACAWRGCALTLGSGCTPGSLHRKGLIPASAALGADGGFRLFSSAHPNRVPGAFLSHCLSSLSIWHFPMYQSPNQEVGDKPCEHIMLSLQPHFMGSAAHGEGLFTRWGERTMVKKHCSHIKP